MPADRPSLTASVLGGPSTALQGRFDRIDAADDFAPIPRGSYTAVAVSGGLMTSRTGTPGYTVTFRVCEGEFTGRRLWRTFFLSDAALPYSKRDLAKLGITNEAQLERPFPADRIVCKLAVVVRKDDDGVERNDVRQLDFLRTTEPTPDPFAPAEPGEVVPAAPTPEAGQ